MAKLRITTNRQQMKLLYFATSAILSFFTFATSYAQKTIYTSVSAVSNTTEIANNVQTNMNQSTEDSMIKQDEHLSKVWKHRSRYVNFGYGTQTMKGSSTNMKSDMAFALVMGHTYYLHKKPIGGLLKFGMDLNYIDLNFAKYPDFQETKSKTSQVVDANIPDLGIMQFELGVGIGPSVTVNPIDQLKICGYFHVTPSYSLLTQNDELYSHYATFFNAGLTTAYKAVQLGVEMRWCSATRYGAASFGRVGDVYDDNGNFHDPFEKIDVPMKTNTCRFFIGFRF